MQLDTLIGVQSDRSRAAPMAWDREPLVGRPAVASSARLVPKPRNCPLALMPQTSSRRPEAGGDPAASPRAARLRVSQHVGVHLRVERSCPLPKTHNRLRQTHDLWHELQAAYPDADEFVTKLNASLTAARSVTFVLQKELSHQPWFDDWYGPWQERMRADPLMRWLVEARNAVEKQGDLDTASVALVSLLLTDDERLLDRLEVPPLASPAEVAQVVKLTELPGRIRDQAVLAVERRWTVPELADGELLDTLAHCYGVLAGLVSEAHERMGVRMQTFGGEEHGARHDRRPHPSGRLPCMLSTAEARTAYWHLGERSLMHHVTKMVERAGPDALEQAAGRYGIGGGQHGLMPGLSPRHRAAAMHALGKRMLEVDGFHRTFAWLYRDDKQVAMLVLDPEDQQDKVVKIRRLAQEVQRTGADTVLLTTEAWLAPEVDDEDPRATCERASGRIAARSWPPISCAGRAITRRGSRSSAATTTAAWYSATPRSSRTSLLCRCSPRSYASGRRGRPSVRDGSSAAIGRAGASGRRPDELAASNAFRQLAAARSAAHGTCSTSAPYLPRRSRDQYWSS